MHVIKVETYTQAIKEYRSSHTKQGRIHGSISHVRVGSGAVTENPEFYFNLREKTTFHMGRLQKMLNFSSVSGKKLLFTFAKKMLSFKGKNSGAMSWLSAP